MGQERKDELEVVAVGLYAAMDGGRRSWRRETYLSSLTVIKITVTTMQ